MGGTTSKPTAAPTPTFSTVDLTKGATITLETAQQAQQQLQRQAEDALKYTQTQLTTAISSGGWGWFVAKLAGLAAVIIGLLALYDYIAFKTNIPQIPNFLPPNIFSATYDGVDVTQKVMGMIDPNTGNLNIPANLSTTLGTVAGPSSSFTIKYQFPKDTNQYTYTVNDTTSVVISSTSKPGTASAVSSSAPSSAPVSTPQQPGLLSRIWSSITGGGSSGNLISSIHDATTSGSVQGTSAPLSSQDQGAYGMQWWMFIKDWNYGYGKDKPVLTRPDPTSSSIANPAISLHPTDNSLKVSVSLFPSSDGGSKTEPAPATSSGSSTDDVYVCEVYNLPLQAWFSVGVTVFGRNLDVYIDGKLVKSCFLPGVPKPAVGDVQLSPGGGFSGYLCDYYHYPRMLTPDDAMTFYTSGTSCKNKVASDGNTPGTTSMSGYSVKFGVYDTLGKQVQEYTF